MVFYKKPSSKHSTESFLIFGHILVLKVSKKFYLFSRINRCESVRRMRMKQTICTTTNKMRQYELNSKTMSYSHCFGTAVRRTQATSMHYLLKVSWLFLVFLEAS